MTNVVAVVVTYHPQFEILQNLITVLQNQVTAIVIVDNTPDSEALTRDDLRGCKNTTIINLDKNYGIGYAQNIGIKYALTRDATHILLMDQDSVPATDMVDHLLMVAERFDNVASVGPSYIDTCSTAKSPFVRLSGIWLKRWEISEINAVIPVDFLISSGSLLPVASLKMVGLLREDFFIDYVDVEWCLRARKNGLQSYGVCSAKMMHSLGESSSKFLGVEFPVQKSFRLYYQFRNAILLCQESWLPRRWRYAIGLNIFMKYWFYLLQIRSGRDRMRMINRGVLDGFNGRTGVVTSNDLPPQDVPIDL